MPRKPFNYKLLALIPAGLLIFAGLAFAVLNITKPKESISKVLATVGSTEITRRDLNEQIYGIDFEGSVESPKNVDPEKKKELLHQLIEWEVIKLKAKEFKLEVSEEDYKAEALERLGDTGFETLSYWPKDQKKITEEVIRNSALKKKVKDKVVSWKEGDILVVRFDKYIDIPNEELKVEWEQDRDAKIKRDREHADKLIKELYGDVKGGSITFKQAMEKASADVLLGTEAFKPVYPSFSRSFTKEDWQENDTFLRNKNVKEVLLQSKDGLNEPTLIKIQRVGTEEMVDGFWIVPNIIKSQKGIADNYESWLENLEKNLVKIKDKDYKDLLHSYNANVAYAHSSSTHGCANTDHWGINTGSSSSTAGYIVYTRYYNSSGNGPYALDGVTVKISGNGSNKIRYQPGGTGGITYYSSGSFATGASWYHSGGSCSNDGYAVFGYGTTSGSGYYGNFGNRYHFECSGNNFTVSVNDPAGRVGKWDDSSVAKAMVNGDTVSNTFTWRDNRPPSAEYYSPADSTDYNYLVGGTLDVTLKATVYDPDVEYLTTTFKFGSGSFASTAGVFGPFGVSPAYKTVNFREVNGKGYYKWSNEPDNSSYWKILDLNSNGIADDSLHGANLYWLATPNDGKVNGTNTITNNNGVRWRFQITNRAPTIAATSTIVNGTPVANGGAYTLPSGITTVPVTLRATARDLDWDGKKIQTEIIGGETFAYNATEQGSGAADYTRDVTSSANLSAGSYTWRTKTIDIHGNESGYTERTFSIGNAPVPSCNLSANPNLGLLPLSVEYSITISDVSWTDVYYDINVLRTDQNPPSSYTHNDRVFSRTNSSLNTLFYIYANQGTYYPIARIKDAVGASPANQVQCASNPQIVDVDPWSSGLLKEIAP